MQSLYFHCRIIAYKMTLELLFSITSFAISFGLFQHERKQKIHYKTTKQLIIET